MESFLVDLMVVFVAAVGFGIVFRLFKLPSLVGQVLAGFVVGFVGILGHSSLEVMKLFSTIGVTLLLFLVGLEINWKEIRHSGQTVFKLFLLQTVLLMAVFIFFAMQFLGLAWLPAILFSVALTFSSTIVVVKTLSEGKNINSFVGKISLGTLLLQDLLAIVLLTLVPGLKDGFSPSVLTILFFKISVVLLVVNVIGHLLISWLMKHAIKTTEDLVLFSLAWLFLVVYFAVKVLGLTPEIGGILAGLSLSTSWGHFQIVSKVKTLRDIFLSVFFVLLGFEVGVGVVNWVLVGEMVLMVLVGKFVITSLAGLVSGLKGRIAFSVGMNMTQVSEFSLVVMGLGLSSNLWGAELVSAVIVAGLISMVVSTVLITESAQIYKKLAKNFPSLFKLNGRSLEAVTLKNHIVLLGGDRTGRSIMSFLRKNGERVLVVDFNPEIVSRLKKRGEEAVFADASDPDVVELANMEQAKMIISTVKDVKDSLSLLAELGSRGIKVPVIADAESATEAAELYKAGASYVIFPHFVSGWHLGQLMKKFEKDSDTLKKYRSKQNNTLKEIYEGEF